MLNVLFHLSLNCAFSIREFHQTDTFKHISNKMTEPLAVLGKVCEFADTGGFVSVEDFTAVLNNFVEYCDLLVA